MENRLCTVAPPLATPRVRLRRLPRLVEVDDPTLPREATGGRAARPALSAAEAEALVADEERSHPISAILPRRSPTLVGAEPEPDTLPAALAPAALAPASIADAIVVESAPSPAPSRFTDDAPIRSRSRGLTIVLLTFTLFVAATSLLARRADLGWADDTGVLRHVTRGHRADVLRDVRGTRIEALPPERPTHPRPR